MRSFSLKTKKVAFASLRESILGLKYVSLHTLQRFAGKATSFTLAVPAARLYTREINAGISKCQKTSRPVKIQPPLRAELEHWRFLDNWSGILTWKNEKHFDINISTDASNTGWGGVLTLGNRALELRDYWSEDERSLPIAAREAKALHKLLITFSNEIYNSRVDASVDNTNLIHFWNNEGGKNIPLTNEIKNLFSMSLKLNVTLNLQYVPSAAMEADAPSRYTFDIDCHLAEDTWRLVDRTYGPHTFDLMAIPSNVQKGRDGNNLPFFSPYICSGSKGVNMLAQPLPSQQNLYVFPPFTLIGPLIRYLRSFNARITIIVPDISPRKYWWPIINSLAVDSLLIGKKRQTGVLLFRQTKKNLGTENNYLGISMHFDLSFETFASFRSTQKFLEFGRLQ